MQVECVPMTGDWTYEWKQFWRFGVVTSVNDGRFRDVSDVLFKARDHLRKSAQTYFRKHLGIQFHFAIRPELRKLTHCPIAMPVLPQQQEGIVGVGTQMYSCWSFTQQLVRCLGTQSFLSNQLYTCMLAPLDLPTRNRARQN